MKYRLFVSLHVTILTQATPMPKTWQQIFEVLVSGQLVSKPIILSSLHRKPVKRYYELTTDCVIKTALSFGCYLRYSTIKSRLKTDQCVQCGLFMVYRKY